MEHRKGVQTLQCINSVWHNEQELGRWGNPIFVLGNTLCIGAKEGDPNPSVYKLRLAQRAEARKVGVSHLCARQHTMASA